MTKRNGGGGIRVLVAAASADRRAGLEALVRKSPSLQLAGSLQSMLTVARYAAQLQPDVVVLDLESEGRAPEASTLMRISSDVHVVALIDQPSAGWTARALRSAVRAVLPRDSTEKDLVSAIEAAQSGLVLLDAEVSKTLAARVPAATARREEAMDELTPREVEVLRMLAEGLSNHELASRLGVSDHTVKFHISSILDKLGASTRTEAVTLGIRMGLILL